MGTGKIMNSTGQSHVMRPKIVDHFREYAIVITYHTQVLKARNSPPRPALRRLGIIGAFYASQIQSLAESILPGLKRPGEIRHSTPDAYEISVFIFLCAMSNLCKMRVSICPKVLYKTCAVFCGTLLTDYGKDSLIQLSIFMFSLHGP